MKNVRDQAISGYISREMEKILQDFRNVTIIIDTSLNRETPAAFPLHEISLFTQVYTRKKYVYKNTPKEMNFLFFLRRASSSYIMVLLAFVILYLNRRVYHKRGKKS